MKISHLLFITVLVIGVFAAQNQLSCDGIGKDPTEKVTTLTFYVEREVEQAEDFIEIELTLQQKQLLLKKGIQKVESSVTKIKELVKKFCNLNKGEQCDKRVKLGKHDIIPQYQTIRKQPIFNGFSVVQDILIKIEELNAVGELVDSILAVGVYKINQFKWKPFIELDSEQEAIEVGIAQARDLCNHINRQIGDILSIEEVFNKDQDEDNNNKDKDDDQKNNDDKDEKPSILKFKVQCVTKNQDQKVVEVPKKEEKKKKKKKAKKQE